MGSGPEAATFSTMKQCVGGFVGGRGGGGGEKLSHYSLADRTTAALLGFMVLWGNSAQV